jgi:hypothetical protein
MLDCTVKVDQIFPENSIYDIMDNLYKTNPSMLSLEHESFIFKFRGSEYEVLPKKSGKGMVYHIVNNGFAYFSCLLNKNRKPVLTFRTPIADTNMAELFIGLISLYQKSDNAILNLELIQKWYEV